MLSTGGVVRKREIPDEVPDEVREWPTNFVAAASRVGIRPYHGKCKECSDCPRRRRA
jgi:hypothetical protein